MLPPTVRSEGRHKDNLKRHCSLLGVLLRHLNGCLHARLDCRKLSHQALRVLPLVHDCCQLPAGLPLALDQALILLFQRLRTLPLQQRPHSEDPVAMFQQCVGASLFKA